MLMWWFFAIPVWLGVCGLCAHTYATNDPTAKRDNEED